MRCAADATLSGNNQHRQEHRQGAARYRIQRAASNEEAQLHLAPCNSGEMTFDTTIKDARKDSKGGRKRHKQRLQEATTAAGDDVDNSKQAGGSGTMHTTTIAGSDKR
jgi:hypothetical protein